MVKKKSIKKLKTAKAPKKSAKKPSKGSTKLSAKAKPRKRAPARSSSRGNKSHTPALAAVKVRRGETPTPAIDPAPQSASERSPIRAPMRKIIGADRKVITLPIPQAIGSKANTTNEIKPADQSATSTAPSELPVKPAVYVAPVIQELPSDVQWSELPPSVPPATRFLMNAFCREAQQAAAWPFPYATFIAALPNKMCGMEFAILLLSLDLNSTQIALRLDVSQAEVESLLAKARADLEDLFSSICGSMALRFRAQVGKPGIKVNQLVEQFLVANVDRDMQCLLGTLLLRVMDSTEPAHIAAAQVHAG